MKWQTDRWMDRQTREDIRIHHLTSADDTTETVEVLSSSRFSTKANQHCGALQKLQTLQGYYSNTYLILDELSGVLQVHVLSPWWIVNGGQSQTTQGVTS